MREDIPGINTNQAGEDNRDGQWHSNIGDVFVQGSLMTPSMATDLKADVGLRVVFPTGGLKPYGTGRYQIAPHIGFDWTLPGSASFLSFAPLARYFQSIGDRPPHSIDTSQIQFHPELTARLGDGWAVSLWRENPIILDTLDNQWFVPLDVMVNWQVVPAVTVGIGDAVGLVNNYAQFDNMIYARFAVTF